MEKLDRRTVAEQSETKKKSKRKVKTNFELTNEQAEYIAEEVILKDLPTWLKRNFNVFIAIPVLDEQHITACVTAQPDYGRMLQRLAQNSLGIVTQDGCMQ